MKSKLARYFKAQFDKRVIPYVVGLLTARGFTVVKIVERGNAEYLVRADGVFYRISRVKKGDKS